MKRVLFPLLILALASAACNLLAGPTPARMPSATAMPTLALLASPTQPPATSAPATVTSAPAAPASPTAPPTIPATQPTRAATQPPAPTAAGQVMRLKIFLIALEDAGASGKKIGCDDSAVPVTIEVPRTQGVLRAALNRLLEIDDQYYGESGLYNALYQSDLAIDSLVIQDGEAILHLSGELVSGGVCDDPRIISQIEETALQFSTVQKVTIFVNGVRIQELLSGRGG